MLGISDSWFELSFAFWCVWWKHDQQHKTQRQRTRIPKIKHFESIEEYWEKIKGTLRKGISRGAANSAIKFLVSGSKGECQVTAASKRKCSDALTIVRNIDMYV